MCDKGWEKRRHSQKWIKRGMGLLLGAEPHNMIHVTGLYPVITAICHKSPTPGNVYKSPSAYSYVFVCVCIHGLL